MKLLKILPILLIILFSLIIALLFEHFLFIKLFNSYFQVLCSLGIFLCFFVIIFDIWKYADADGLSNALMGLLNGLNFG